MVRDLRHHSVTETSLVSSCGDLLRHAVAEAFTGPARHCSVPAAAASRDRLRGSRRRIRAAMRNGGSAPASHQEFTVA
jgi:hypothetical protein